MSKEQTVQLPLKEKPRNSFAQNDYKKGSFNPKKSIHSQSSKVALRRNSGRGR